MSKLVTTGKRYLKDGRWHDDSGPMPDEPRDWEQERVAPDRTARAYLAVIAAAPRTVEKALRSSNSAAE